MLSTARVVPTLAVSDMDRARRFYEEGLGLAVEADVVGTVRYSCGGGTALAIFERPMEPVDRTVAAFEVEDIEAEVNELRGGAWKSRTSSRCRAASRGRSSRIPTAT